MNSVAPAIGAVIPIQTSSRSLTYGSGRNKFRLTKLNTAVDVPKFAPDMTGRLCTRHPLAKEENVGGDLGPGVPLESCIGQADGAQQVRTFREVGTYRIILLVHRVSAGNECHDSAGPGLLK